MTLPEDRSTAGFRNVVL